MKIKEPEEILRLVYESKTEVRELAFGSDHLVFIRYEQDGKTEGWKLASRWENIKRLEQIAFEKCNEEGWMVAWNEKYLPEGWKSDK